MQPSVSLSMAEGELIAAEEALQMMLFAIHMMEDIISLLKKPMILQVDCKGVLDLTYEWNSSCLTRHVSARACFLHELKEANLIVYV